MKALQSIALAVGLVLASGMTPVLAQGAKTDAAKGKRIQGEVAVVNEFTNQVTVKTKDVPGMEGKTTTVAFIAKDATALKKFHEGDKVEGDLVVKGIDTYLENVTVVGGAKKGS